MSTETDGTTHVDVLGRVVLLVVASATFLILSSMSGTADGIRRDAALEPPRHHEPSPAATADFAVTPAASPLARDFVRSRSDFSRAVVVGGIVIPLMLILLAEGELLSVGGRTQGRVLVAYGFPLLAMFALLAYARIRTYMD